MNKEIKIEVLSNGILQVKESLEKENNRYVLFPDTKIDTIENSIVREKALQIWTPKVIEDYKNNIKELEV
jgi:hypothetical protein